MLTIRITSADQGHLTPHELLEDFADSTAGWQYLNKVSANYSDVRGAESCVLRNWNSGVPGSVDIAFSGSQPETLELTIVAKNDLIQNDARSSIVQNFADEFDRYLENRPARIKTERVEAVPA